MGFILKDSDQTIIKIINEAFIKKFTKGFYDRSNIGIIEDVVRSEVRKAIVNTKVWQSLLNGGPKGLDAHFGIPASEKDEKLETLLGIWEKEILVVPEAIKRRARTVVFSYRFYAIEAHWANVLNSSAGVTINDSRNSRAGKTPREIPWLEWLLVSGDQFEIDGYTIDFGNYAASRSGKALMRPKLSWRIPTGFGPFAADNNFITNALEELAQEGNFRNKMTGIFRNISRMEDSDSPIQLFGDIDTGEL